ncbi:MAG: hypothetical protein AAGB51_15080 [Planctomycetota bacterium]
MVVLTMCSASTVHGDQQPEDRLWFDALSAAGVSVQSLAACGITAGDLPTLIQALSASVLIERDSVLALRADLQEATRQLSSGLASTADRVVAKQAEEAFGASCEAFRVALVAVLNTESAIAMQNFFRPEHAGLPVEYRVQALSEQEIEAVEWYLYTQSVEDPIPNLELANQYSARFATPLGLQQLEMVRSRVRYISPELQAYFETTE